MNKNKSNLSISIIIVNFKSFERIVDLIKSIRNSIIKVGYEIIIVDNENDKQVKDLIKKFDKNMFYVKAMLNKGYGAGCNLGSRVSRGKYLLFINPDCYVLNDAINVMFEFIKKNIDCGIVAPLLCDKNENPYPLQGTGELSPISAIFSLSFFNKYFPNNPISKSYWMKDKLLSKEFEADVVPGTAFMIKKDIYKKVKGFDENFFLYFEEFDLCRRVKKLGFKIIILPKSKIIHYWGESTKYLGNFSKTLIYKKSLFYYFKKNYGYGYACLVLFVNSIGKWFIIFLITVLLLIYFIIK